MGTLIAGMIWAGGALQVAGVRLTLINIVGIPILLGIGVDVVILPAPPPGRGGTGGRPPGPAHHRHGGGDLSADHGPVVLQPHPLASNRGVRSMGLLVVIGLIAVVFASAVILPTAWAAGWRVTGRAPPRHGRVAAVVGPTIAVLLAACTPQPSPLVLDTGPIHPIEPPCDAYSGRVSIDRFRVVCDGRRSGPGQGPGPRLDQRRHGRLGRHRRGRGAQRAPRDRQRPLRPLRARGTSWSRN